MATIRSASGELFDGPDDAPIPSGFERVGAANPTAAPVNAISTKAEVPLQQSWAERMGQRGVDRAKEIANFPVRVGRLVAGADKPQSFEDTALLALGNAIPIAATGGLAGALGMPTALAPYAPALGRVAASAGLAKLRGEDNRTAMLEGFGAATGEVGGAVATKVMGSVANGLESLAGRLVASPKAMTQIMQRMGVPPGANVDAKIVVERFLDQALKWWKEVPDISVQGERAAKLATELRRIDPSGESTRIFREQVAKGVKVPMTKMTGPTFSPGFSEAARAVTASPITRATVDAAMSSDPTPGAVTAIGAQSAGHPLRLAAHLLGH